LKTVREQAATFTKERLDCATKFEEVSKRVAENDPNALYKSECAVYNLASVLQGGIAQLGERLHGMQEVSGSIPLTSTNRTK
jgi:hypothetical protein